MSANASLESALARSIDELNAASIPYMLIGGLALSAWGLPRATLDIDLTLWVPSDDLDRVCGTLCSRYEPRVADPRKFVDKSRVLPVTTNTGVRIDFLFAVFPFEKEMVERAVLRQLGDVTVRVATLEDLILLKLPSSRTRDQDDVRLILGAHGKGLEWDYLLSVSDSLAEALVQPELGAFLREHRPPQ
jgi:predicted nucleotidyltransferase